MLNKIICLSVCSLVCVQKVLLYLVKFDMTGVSLTLSMDFEIFLNGTAKESCNSFFAII